MSEQSATPKPGRDASGGRSHAEATPAEEELPFGAFGPAGPVVERPRVVIAVGLSVVVFVGSIVAIALAWPTVPAQIPLQWSAGGSPGGAAPAWVWWFVPLLGLAFGVGLPLAGAHMIDRLTRVPAASLGAGLGVWIPLMTAQIVLGYAGADPALVSNMPNVFASLAAGVLAAVLAAVLFWPTRATPPAQPDGVGR